MPPWERNRSQEKKHSILCQTTKEGQLTGTCYSKDEYLVSYRNTTFNSLWLFKALLRMPYFTQTYHNICMYIYICIPSIWCCHVFCKRSAFCVRRWFSSASSPLPLILFASYCMSYILHVQTSTQKPSPTDTNTQDERFLAWHWEFPLIFMLAEVWAVC